MPFMFGFHFIAVPFLVSHSVVLVVFSPCVSTHLPPYTTYFTLGDFALDHAVSIYPLENENSVYFLRHSACNIQITLQL
jgi:hypothetical protein